MSEAFGWCFIGCGKLANKVAAQIVKSGRHKIISVFSRRIEKSAAFTNKFGGTPYDDVRKAICSEGVDGVYIVTPHNSHFEYAKLALNCGKPVLCEKPFTVNTAQAKELISLAKDKNLYITEAMWTWFSPVANKVKEWLDGDELGTVQSVFINWHMPLNTPRVKNPITAGGALLDIGIYAVAYIYRLFGKPQTVTCTGKVLKGIDLCENIKFSYPSGLECTASISIKDFKGFEKLILKGGTAKISIPNFHCANKVKLVRNGGKAEKFSGNGNYLNEFDLVASEISSGLKESKFVGHTHVTDVMEILDECRRQLNLVYPFE